MVMVVEGREPFGQQLHTAAEHLLYFPSVLAGAILLFSLMYLDQAIEDFTLMMALEADGKNPFKWQEYIKSGEVKTLPQPWPGQHDYPDIIRYDILYPGLPKI